MKSDCNLTTIILAAGKGTRMLSSYPKWSHTIGNFSLLEHAIYKAQALDSKETIGVFSNKDKEQIEKLFKNLKIAVQNPASGTAHAVLSAKDFVSNTTGVILILYCDTPLISIATLTTLVNLIKDNKAQVAFVGFNETKPNSYGRLVVEGNNLIDILETKNSKSGEGITLCNSGIVAISAKIIWDLLEKVDNNNLSKEYYLTDIVRIANNLGYCCKYVLETETQFAKGINTKEELSVLENIFQNTKRKEFLDKGVTLIDPNTVFFSLDTKIGKDVVIHPFNVFYKEVVIGDNVTIESFSHISQANIKSGAIIGPYARIRKNTTIENNVKVGNFVEIKNSKLNCKVTVKHLSYIGDTVIGNASNIGAGTITCNYDGIKKYNTRIGSNSFIGANVSLIAPLDIGDNVLIGAGSVITKSVASNSLAIERNKQLEKKNWCQKRRL